jgi:bacteriorhodopsin
MNPKINRVLYAGFIAISIFMLCKSDYVTAASNMGIALVFDPFDPKQEWKQRPVWQRAWLIIHLAIVAGLFGLGLGLDDRP